VGLCTISIPQNLPRRERGAYIAPVEMARAALEWVIAQWIEEHDK
jgi:hypothetical protein